MRVSTRALAGQLCVLLAGPAAATGAAASLGHAESAALAALRGHPGRARALLRSGDDSDPAALVVLASLALDEGNLEDAARVVERLRGLRPGATETQLLESLLAERGAGPRGDWLEAGLGALKALHPWPPSPPLLDLWSHVQTLEPEDMALPEEALRELGAADAFLVRWAWPRPQRDVPEDLVESAIRFADADERLVVHLAALDVLGRRDGAPAAARRAAAGRALVERLRRRQPGALLCLDLDEHGEKEPVSEAEVARIEQAVAPAAVALFASQYSDLLRVLGKVDPALAPGMAMGHAVDLVMRRYWPGPLRSRLALKPALPGAARERLARALVRLADAAEGEGLVLTDMLAAAILGVADGLSPDPALAARGQALRAEASAMRDASRCLKPLLGLPIRSLQRAWADQMARERAFLYRGMVRRGLTCPEVPDAPGPAPAPGDESRQGAPGCPDDPPE